MQLSKRMDRLASMVTEGSSLADVGTDHGYIPIALVQTGKVSRAIAMDINKGPLERAALHIREQHLEDRITTRLSDGMTALKEGEADTVLIAGICKCPTASRKARTIANTRYSLFLFLCILPTFFFSYNAK